MNIVQTGGLVVFSLALGGVLGWVIEDINNRMPGDSPVRVVGGSITARDHKGWQPASGCSPSLCYQSTTPVKLDKMTVELTGASTSYSFTNDWMVEVFDRNQNHPGVNGIKICSQPTCSTTGAISSSKGPVYLMPEPSNSAFYQIPAPRDNTANDQYSDAGVRFHDSDTSCGKINQTVAGVVISVPVDQDYCERIGSIAVTSNGMAVPSISGNCDDGACKVHFGK